MILLVGSLVLLFGGIVAAWILYFFKYKYIIDVTKDIPSAPTLPLVGHGHYYIGKSPEEVITITEGFYEKYGKTFKIWLGMELNIMIAGIKDIEVVLTKPLFNDKAGEYAMLESWLHKGLLVSSGRKWFQRRKIITPAFHFKVLEQFTDIFEEQSKILVKNLKHVLKVRNPDGFNLYDWINLCTLDTICETAMGVSINAQTNADSDYVRAVKTISTVLHKRMFDILYRLDLTYKFTKLAREEKRALAILHGFTEKIIIQRREELLKGSAGHHDLDSDEVGAKKKLAFLDILLQSEIDGKPLSNIDIREEVDTFMFEGHDTTSSAITFFFYNVALHPGYQQKCFDEILAIFGKDKTKTATFEDLNKMHFMELCIKETLRMFPSVPLLGRKVDHECEINGKIIPAGTNIGISPLLMGRMEDLFPKANEFIPERFDVVATAEKMNPFAFIPFSAGPRNCIGQKFAMLEMKSIAANVLRHFVVEYVGNPAEEPQLVAELILRTKDPLKFMIRPRVY